MAIYCDSCFDLVDSLGDSRFCVKCENNPDVINQCETSDKLKIGTKLLGGKVVIGKCVGNGTYGNTYKAKLTYERELRSIQAIVAIKEFFPKGDVSRKVDGKMVIPATEYEQYFIEDKKRSLQEGEILEDLSREKGWDSIKGYTGFEENNTVYNMMDFVDGDNIDDYWFSKGGGSASELLKLLEPVFKTIRVAHNSEKYNEPIIHRDIKPDNIIVKDGKAYLVDWGSARAQSRTNNTGYAQFTTGYAAIEQHDSENPRLLTPATDIYGLGATIYNLLTKCNMPSAEDRARHKEVLDDVKKAAEKAKQEGIISVAEININESAAIMKALSIHAADRYQSVDDFLRDLKKPVVEAGGTQNERIDSKVSENKKEIEQLQNKDGNDKPEVIAGNTEYKKEKPKKSVFKKIKTSIKYNLGLYILVGSFLYGMISAGIRGGKLGVYEFISYIPLLIRGFISSGILIILIFIIFRLVRSVYYDVKCAIHRGWYRDLKRNLCWRIPLIASLIACTILVAVLVLKPELLEPIKIVLQGFFHR